MKITYHPASERMQEKSKSIQDISEPKNYLNTVKNIETANNFTQKYCINYNIHNLCKCNKANSFTEGITFTKKHEQFNVNTQRIKIR